MANNSIQQTIMELEQHLTEQIQFLIASADSYDKGFDGEAKRLAATIRILVHDTKKSYSLLGQLNRLSANFISTVVPFTGKSLGSFSGLVTVGLAGKESRFVAMLDKAIIFRWQPFEEWWSEIVFVDDKNSKLSRRDIILTMADQDGGAHVDPALEETYARLSRDNSLGWSYFDGCETGSIPKPERAAIRQIAHEVLRTLLPKYSKQPIINEIVLLGDVRVGEKAGPPINRIQKIGRNELCPCGSSLKLKMCHGVNWFQYEQR